MARRVFYSFNFDDDAWRVSQVKHMGVVSGQPILTANKFEEVKKGGKSAIRKWIDDNMDGRSCVVVLIWRRTADRDWVGYEIKKGWTDRHALLGSTYTSWRTSASDRRRRARIRSEDSQSITGALISPQWCRFTTRRSSRAMASIGISRRTLRLGSSMLSLSERSTEAIRLSR
jgi:hypothetical protein